MRNILLNVALAGSVVAATAAPGVAQKGTPKNGTELLEMMRQKYAKKWFTTLTFSQTTTMRQRDGSDKVETWYESLRYTPGAGGQLRIDQGEPSAGNGSLSTADSTWGVRAGKLARANGSGNPFIPFIENVYLQPVDQTVKQIASMDFDLTKVGSTDWQGRPAWIVGATSVADSAAPQFWIDKERLVIVRMLVILAQGRPPYDIHLDKYVPIGGGWLATKVTMFANGTPQQTEEYAGWKAGMTLDPKLFDPATWSTATHWKTQ